MNLIFGVLGGVCLAYFLFLLSAGMDFSYIWLLGAAFFWGLLAARHLSAMRLIHIGRAVKIVFGLLVGVGALVFGVSQACIIGSMHAVPEGELDYLIVLGAQVRGSEPSKALGLRIEKAAQVWRTNGEPTLLLSGGRGEGEDISEAECMRRTLVKMGIPREKMILEDASTSTQENLMFCAGLSDCKRRRTGIVTNNFHVFRAGWIAKNLGYEHVSLAAAPSDWRFQVHYMVRESFAIVLSFLR